MVQVGLYFRINAKENTKNILNLTTNFYRMCLPKCRCEL